MKTKTTLSILSALTLLLTLPSCGDSDNSTADRETKGVSVATAEKITTKAATQPTTVVTILTTTTAQTTTEKETEAPTEAPTEKQTEATTKKKTKAYGEGMYKVGKDIPEGEYILYNLSDRNAYTCVSDDANQNDIIFNENFPSDLIITVYDDEYLELSRCMAIDLDELIEGNEDKTDTLIDVVSDRVDEGVMYKVGLMLEEGEYKLETTGKRSGYYCIYSDSRHRDIVANDNFDNSTYVEVSDGEYLLLSRCKIVE